MTVEQTPNVKTYSLFVALFAQFTHIPYLLAYITHLNSIHSLQYAASHGSSLLVERKFQGRRGVEKHI